MREEELNSFHLLCFIHFRTRQKLKESASLNAYQFWKMMTCARMPAFWATHIYIAGIIAAIPPNEKPFGHFSGNKTDVGGVLADGFADSSQSKSRRCPFDECLVFIHWAIMTFLSLSCLAWWWLQAPDGHQIFVVLWTLLLDLALCHDRSDFNQWRIE